MRALAMAVLLLAGCPGSGGTGSTLTVTVTSTPTCAQGSASFTADAKITNTQPGRWIVTVTARLSCIAEGADGSTTTVPVQGARITAHTPAGDQSVVTDAQGVAKATYRAGADPTGNSFGVDVTYLDGSGDGATSTSSTTVTVTQ